ncbi:ribonuclease H-like domain protein [Vibrio phage 1.210.O._10N.222.52.C2]|nr:ribonuclease H-like domain protein [Vibrio phage 1.210.O._10N.222.52.C2]
MSDIFVMLDLETLGNRINPVIVQISAVAFTLEGGSVSEEFNVLVDRESCENVGLETNESTLQWWSEQSKEAKSIVFDNSKDRLGIRNALQHFDRYLKSLKHYGDNVYLWGNGIRADNVWLLSAYKAIGAEDPISYNQDLDYRTLHYLSKKKTGIDFKKQTEFKGVQHNAIDDCKYQIECAVKMWESLL